MAASALGRAGRHARHVQDRRRRRATRRCSPASIPPRPARSPPRSTRAASATRSKNNGTALAVVKSQVAAGAHRARREGPPRQRPARLRALRQAEARRLRLPAEGHLPARARGPDRLDDRPDPGRLAARRCARAPEDQLFSEDQTPATAAVLLSAARDEPRPGAVRGIASLVSSSVKGLKPANVSITDATGALLWPNSDGGAGDGRRRAASSPPRRATTRQLQGSLDAMLAQTLGAGKAQVAGLGDLNVDETTLDKLTYAKKGVAAHRQGERDAARRRRRGPAARPARLEQPALLRGQRRGAAATRTTSAKSTQTDFGVDKTVQRTKVAPGEVNRLSVGLVVDKSVPPAAGRAAQERRLGRRRHRHQARRHPQRQPGRLRQAATTAPAAGPAGGDRSATPSTAPPASACSPSCSSSCATSRSASASRSASRPGCARSSRRRRSPTSRPAARPGCPPRPRRCPARARRA